MLAGLRTICLGVFLVHDRIRVGSCLTGEQALRSVRSVSEGLASQSRVQSSPLQVPIGEGHENDC